MAVGAPIPSAPTQLCKNPRSPGRFIHIGMMYRLLDVSDTGRRVRPTLGRGRLNRAFDHLRHRLRCERGVLGRNNRQMCRIGGPAAWQVQHNINESMGSCRYASGEHAGLAVGRPTRRPVHCPRFRNQVSSMTSLRLSVPRCSRTVPRSADAIRTARYASPMCAKRSRREKPMSNRSNAKRTKHRPSRSWR